MIEPYTLIKKINGRDLERNDMIDISYYDTKERTYYTYKLLPENEKVKIKIYKELPDEDGVKTDTLIDSKILKHENAIKLFNKIIDKKDLYEDFIQGFTPKGYFAEREKQIELLKKLHPEYFSMKGYKKKCQNKSKQYGISYLKNSVKNMF